MTLQEQYLKAEKGCFPVSHEAYDQLVVDLALAIEKSLLKAGKLGFGAAQKLVNLMMKGLWAWGIIKQKLGVPLHAPVDRRILSKLKNVPSTWPSWTKAVARRKSSKTVTDYRAIQRKLRMHWHESSIKFPSVIRMEQFIWHQIPSRK